MQNSDNFKRGTAEMLILHLLQQEDLYGYQITQAFKDKTGGQYFILEGSLYNILFRLTEAGYITDYVKRVGVKRTKKPPTAMRCCFPAPCSASSPWCGEQLGSRTSCMPHTLLFVHSLGCPWTAQGAGFCTNCRKAGNERFSMCFSPFL